MTKALKEHIHNMIAMFAQKTLAEIPFHQEADPTDQTHSQLGKDHDDNPLHELAAKNAIIMLNDIGGVMSNIWKGKATETELLNKIDLYFTHPERMDYDNSTPHIKQMYKETQEWSNINAGKITKSSEYKGVIEHAKKELEKIANKSTEASSFILDTYLKYGIK